MSRKAALRQASLHIARRPRPPAMFDRVAPLSNRLNWSRALQARWKVGAAVIAAVVAVLSALTLTASAILAMISRFPAGILRP